MPPNGRGADIYLYLMSLGLPVCAEQQVVSAVAALRSASGWTHESPLWQAADMPCITPKDSSERNSLICSPEPMIFITGDGMLTSQVALQYYEGLKDDPRSRIIITGHAAEGTVGASIFSDAFRKENRVQAQTEKITVKVHPDESDALCLLENCNAKQVMLFHAAHENCSHISVQISAKGISCICDTEHFLIL